MDVIFVNGPQQVGKTTQRQAMAASAYISFPNAVVQSTAVSDELKRLTHRFYGLSEEPETYERSKNAPSDDFWGSTPRAEYVWMYERVLVPRFGPAVLAKITRRLLLESQCDLAIVECGLAIEASALLGHKDRAVIVQYHNGSPGFSDYREYLECDWPVIVVQDAHKVPDIMALAHKTLKQAAQLFKAL